MSQQPSAPTPAFAGIGDLRGQVAVVTGSTSGIGLALARAVAAGGGDVVLNGLGDPAEIERTRAELEASSGVRVRYHPADMTRGEEIADMVAFAQSQLGRLDILVNNAGVLAIAPLEDFKLEDFDQTLAINVRSVFIATEAAAKHMTEGGRIINIGSTNADRMPFAGGGPYAMSKSALVGLTKGLARDLGPRGITINNVQPGPVDTDMNPADGDFADSLIPLMAVGRYGTSEEIASFVAYLVGPEAGYITGASLTIDGGFGA